MLGQVLPLGLGYAVFVAMARLITPADYGLFTLAALWIGFISVPADLGLGVALLRQPEVKVGLAEAAFRLTLAIGFGLTLVNIGLAYLYGLIVGYSPIVPVTAVLSLRLLTDAFTYVPTDISQRHFRFRFLAVRDSFAILVGGTVGIVAAARGAGVWSLVLSVLIQGTLTATMFQFGLRRRARRADVDWQGVRGLVPFGLQITYQQAFKYFTQSADSLVVGAVLGAAPLGIYRVAQRVGLDSAASLRLGIGSFLLPALASRRDAAAAKTEVVDVLRALSAVVGPLMVLVGLAADSIVVVVLGSQWRAAIPVVQILCVAGAVQLLFLPVGEVMKAAGKGAWLLWWTVGFTVLLVCAVFVGAHRGGLEGVAIGYLSGHLLALPAGLHILRLLAGVRLWELVVALRGIAMALVCEGAAIAVSRHFTDPYSLGGLVIVVGCAAAGYLFVLRLADRGVIRYSFGRRVM